MKRSSRCESALIFRKRIVSRFTSAATRFMGRWLWNQAALLWLFCLVLDGDQFHVEQESGIGRNRRVGNRSITQLWRQDQLPLRADRHHAQRLGPAFDDIRNRRDERLAFVRVVELLSVNERASILRHNRVGEGGDFAGA